MAITANPLTSQIEFPVSARILEGFSGFLLEVDDGVAAVEAPEDAELVDEATVPPVPEPASPGVTGGGVDRIARRYTGLKSGYVTCDIANILDPSADIETDEEEMFSSPPFLPSFTSI